MTDPVSNPARKTLLTVFGTRPEAIKMAPVVAALKQVPEFDVRVCVTAQHREMLDQVLALFDITPDYDLNIMAPGQDLFDVTSRVLLGMRDVLKDCAPDMVLVHGDTTTCFSAGLAAFYAGVPVGHVEAGLRTGNMRAPFPEEANRSLVAPLCTLNFSPTRRASDNLLAEGRDPATIAVTGNTVIDALLEISARVTDMPAAHWRELFGAKLFDRVNDSARQTILITGHRRENFGQGFRDLCGAIRDLAEQHSDWNFVYPVHLNPNVQAPVKELLSGLDNVHLIEPLDYLPFVWLMNQCDLILTDSGGVQEEGPSLGKPVLVMREVTERPEALDAGTVRLVGTSRTQIVDGVTELLTNRAAYDAMARAINPYGDGKAARRIAERLRQHFWGTGEFVAFDVERQ